jgi:Fic family protein
MSFNLKIISTNLFEEYISQVDKNLSSYLYSLSNSESSTHNFNFYTSVSAIASSKIESETLDIDSYVKHKLLNIEYQPNLLEKPNDLYNAYVFAQNNNLTSENFLMVHRILTKHLLPENKQGTYRKSNMVVLEHNTVKIQYETPPPKELEKLMKLLWEDIEELKIKNLNVIEVFYFASYIHLVLVNIHPFEDGNGRSARLIEKWFLSEKLGKKAWFIQSELYYYKNVNDYYKNFKRLGMFYEQLDYSMALPFLLMLSNAIKVKMKSEE